MYRMFIDVDKMIVVYDTKVKLSDLYNKKMLIHNYVPAFFL